MNLSGAIYHAVLQFVSVSTDYVSSLVFHGAMRVGFDSKEKSHCKCICPIWQFFLQYDFECTIFCKSSPRTLLPLAFWKTKHARSSSSITSASCIAEILSSANWILVLEGMYFLRSGDLNSVIGGSKSKL